MRNSKTAVARRLRPSAGRFLGVLSTLVVLSGDAATRPASIGQGAPDSRPPATQSMGSLPPFDFLANTGAGRTRSGSATRPSGITVRLRNQADVDPQVLALAQQEMTRIYKPAGVELAWMDCSRTANPAGLNPACHGAPRPTEVLITVVDKSTVYSVNTLGRSVCPKDGIPAAYATVFFDRVHQMASGRRDTAMILGYAMAHELGHLLLGAASHSAVGIMRPIWSNKDVLTGLRVQFSFSKAQRTNLRAAVLTRTHLTIARNNPL